LKNIKIILLAPVVFDKHNNDLVEQVILNLDKKNASILFSENEWENLDSEDGYLNTVNGDVNIIDAISTERNLNPLIYKNLIDPLNTEYKNHKLELNANLIVNEKHNFLMLFEFNFKDLQLEDCSSFISKIMNHRNLFKETDNIDFYDSIKTKSINIINKFITNVLNNTKLSISEKNFTIDSNYPLIFVNGFNQEDNLPNLFLNEENKEQRNNSSQITEDFDDAFTHIGWNYGIVKDVPKNVSQKYLCMLIFLQLIYYLLRFYKHYFQKKIKNLSNQHSFNEKEIINFDKLKVLYHKEYLGYKTYKSGLFPKFYKEFENIEILWHMEEDITFIEKTFEVQNDYINKHFQLGTEKTNRNLNYGISIIGLIQVFAIYSIFNDYVSLKKEEEYISYLNYATTSIIATIVTVVVFFIILYIRMKKKK